MRAYNENKFSRRTLLTYLLRETRKWQYTNFRSALRRRDSVGRGRILLSRSRKPATRSEKVKRCRETRVCVSRIIKYDNRLRVPQINDSSREIAYIVGKFHRDY